MASSSWFGSSDCIYLTNKWVRCSLGSGTVTGVSQFIKGCDEFNLPPLKPDLQTIAVEPQEQMLLTEAKGGEKIGDQGPHKIQGMGAGLVPDVIDLDLVNEVVPIHSEKARRDNNPSLAGEWHLTDL